MRASSAAATAVLSSVRSARYLAPLDDLRAPVLAIATRTIRMISIETAKDTRSMQEGVHQAVDRDERRPSAQTSLSLWVSPEKKIGKDYRPKFVGDANDMPEPIKERHSHLLGSLGRQSNSIGGFCAQDVLNVCNGNQIDDRARCNNWCCPMFEHCNRIPHP
jgi:hypothetical protein